LEPANNNHTKKLLQAYNISLKELSAVVSALITLLAEFLKATILSYGIVSVSFPAWDLGLDSRQGDVLIEMFCAL